MTFFEDNLDVFNKQTVSKHLVPGDSSKTFSYIYDSGFKIDQKYIPQRERKERSLEKRRQYTRQVEELEEKTLLNDAMTKSNRNMK
jgi:sulfur relay (sulfurtransferase) DsrF/TusC family protein